MQKAKMSFCVALLVCVAAGAACKEDKKKKAAKDELSQGKYTPPVERKLKPLPRFVCKSAGQLLKWRFDPTLSPLPDGRLLVAGGDAWPGDRGGDARGRERRQGHRARGQGPDADAKTGKSEKGPSMKMPRAMHGAMLLQGGRVLVYSGMVKELELYDPKANKWLSAGRLKKDILGAVAVQLPDGKVYIAGGDPMGAAAFATAGYLLDPKKRRVKKGTALAEGRQGDAFLTKDGKVVLLSRVYGETRRKLETLDLDKGDLKPFKVKDEDTYWKSLRELGAMRGGEHVKLARGMDGKVASPPTALRGKSVLRFFPSRAAWRTLGKLKFDHKDGAIIALSADEILVLGGRTSDAGAVEICTPEEKKEG